MWRLFVWSGKRDSNSRPQPWQGCALPAELFPHLVKWAKYREKSFFVQQVGEFFVTGRGLSKNAFAKDKPGRYSIVILNEVKNPVWRSVSIISNYAMFYKAAQDSSPDCVGLRMTEGRSRAAHQSRLARKQKSLRNWRLFVWSGKRDSNSRPQPWQGCALPAELFPHLVKWAQCREKAISAQQKCENFFDR